MSLSSELYQRINGGRRPRSAGRLQAVAQPITPQVVDARDSQVLFVRLRVDPSTVQGTALRAPPGTDNISAMSKDLPTLTDSDRLGRLGVAIVQKIVEQQIGWLFRIQESRDYGIDGEIEVVKGGSQVTGRLIAAQVKCGNSWFKETDDNGYVFRPENKHVKYWADYSLPVIVILCKPDTEDAWWVEVSDATISRSSTGRGWKIHIPFGQNLDVLAATTLSMIAGRRLEERIFERYRTKIRRAPIVPDSQFFESIARGGLLFGFRRVGEYDYRGLVLTQDYMTIQSDGMYDLALWRETLELAGVEDWEIDEAIEKADDEIF